MNFAFKILAVPAGLLVCASPALATETGAGTGRALLIQLLVLIPLAGLAWWLRRSKLRRAPRSDLPMAKIAASPVHALGNGSAAQILICEGKKLLVITSKTGAIHCVDLGADQPHKPAPEEQA